MELESALASRKGGPSGSESFLSQGRNDYRAIRLGSLLPGSAVPFDVYCPSADSGRDVHPGLLLTRGDMYSQAARDRLLDQRVEVLYVTNEDTEPLIRYIAENIRKVLTDSIPQEEKIVLLYCHAEVIVEKAFRKNASVSELDLAIKLVRAVASQLSAEEASARQLMSVFSQAYRTVTHSVQVSFLAMAFAAYLGWLKSEVADVGAGALFHDVGKNEVDERVLNKKCKLTREELAVVRKHSRLGYEQLKGSYVLSPEQLDVVLHHHEDVSGGGYPDGLKGKAIHKYAKIVRIADCFDAMTTRRPYQEAVSKAEALRVMTEEMEGCFDTYYLEAFSAFCGMDEQVSARLDQGKGIAVEMEGFLQLQIMGSEQRWNGKLVGMETDSCLIVRLPKHPGGAEKLVAGSRVIVRHMCSGTVFGFQSTVLNHTEPPVPLLVLSYPEKVEQHDLRRHKRVGCLLPAETTISFMEYPGVIVDISAGGCRFVSNVLDDDAFLEGTLDTVIHLSFELPGTSGSQDTKGRIKHVQRDGAKLELGIQFFSMPRAVHERLKNFIHNSLLLMSK